MSEHAEPKGPADETPRDTLVRLVAEVRAFVEHHGEAGTVGFPRAARPREARPVATVAAAPLPEAPLPPVALPVASLQVASLPVAPLPAAGDRPARLAVLREAVRVCTQCGLAATRTNTVFSRGNPEAQLCFIGEAPGADEDAQGVPFVGRAGQLLDKMIGAMGLDPGKDVYICNILKCRPPENRRPTPEEMDTCFPYLHAQLDVVQPRVIVALGNTAVGALLGTKLGITKVRGSWKLYRGRTLVMPTYHPSYLLRPSPQQQEAKRQAWEDLQLVMKELGMALPPKARG